MRNEIEKAPMERLHLGDYVQVKGLNICGIITDITKYNTNSIDKCEYALSYEDADLERKADEEDEENCYCQEILGEAAWFTRQRLILITPGVYSNADREELIL